MSNTKESIAAIATAALLEWNDEDTSYKVDSVDIYEHGEVCEICVEQYGADEMEEWTQEILLELSLTGPLTKADVDKALGEYLDLDCAMAAEDAATRRVECENM